MSIKGPFLISELTDSDSSSFPVQLWTYF